MLFYIDDSDPLSSAQASLLLREAGRKKKKARGERWEGEKEKPFPSSHRPTRACFFFFLAIFIGIPSGNLSEEREPLSGFPSLLFVQVVHARIVR